MTQPLIREHVAQPMGHCDGGPTEAVAKKTVQHYVDILITDIAMKLYLLSSQRNKCEIMYRSVIVRYYSSYFLKLKCRQYPAIPTNYSCSNCTFSNYTD